MRLRSRRSQSGWEKEGQSLGLFADVASRVEDPYFAHAAALAVRGRGATAPNPVVGCVIVAGSRIVGEGFHAQAGGPHAEVAALADAGIAARGADVYVTLEPCSHHGKTPPCTDALIEAGVARVHVGMQDPTADAGGGAEALRSAGIEVRFADDPASFAMLNEGWLKRIATGMPRITAKVALSLDGRPALFAGRRAAITGVAGAEVTRRLRARSDAVMVGAATANVDDPALSVRSSAGVEADRQPARVVVTRSSWMPSRDAALLRGGVRVIVLGAEGVSAGDDVSGVEVVRYAAERGLRGAFEALGGLGINEVLVEPGPRLLTALWGDGMIDELVTVTAGGMAGAAAPALYEGVADGEGVALDHLLEPRETGIVGDVTATVWRPADTV